MMWQRAHRRVPPGWAERAAWPPGHGHAGWKRRRARFMRRIALAFGALLFLSAVGVSTLVSMLIGGRGPAGTTAPVALIILFGLFLAGLLVVSMRRVGRPLGDVV